MKQILITLMLISNNLFAQDNDISWQVFMSDGRTLSEFWADKYAEYISRGIVLEDALTIPNEKYWTRNQFTEQFNLLDSQVLSPLMQRMVVTEFGENVDADSIVLTEIFPDGMIEQHLYGGQPKGQNGNVFAYRKNPQGKWVPDPQNSFIGRPKDKIKGKFRNVGTHK